MPTFAQKYLPLLQSYQEDLLARLEMLINIDSGSGQSEGVAQVMQHLQAWVRELGFSVLLHPTESYGPNLLANRRGKGHLRLLVVGHVDTVYARGAAEKRPFQIRDGLASGPGIIDMKSGVLMGMYAVKALIETNFEEYGEITLLFNNDEEVGSPAARPFFASLLRASMLPWCLSHRVQPRSSPRHAKALINMRWMSAACLRIQERSRTGAVRRSSNWRIR